MITFYDENGVCVDAGRPVDVIYTFSFTRLLTQSKVHCTNGLDMRTMKNWLDSQAQRIVLYLGLFLQAFIGG